MPFTAKLCFTTSSRMFYRCNLKETLRNIRMLCIKTTFLGFLNYPMLLLNAKQGSELTMQALQLT